MIIYINKDNFIAGPYIRDADKEVVILDTNYAKTLGTPKGCAGKYHEDEDDFTLEELLYPVILRARRQEECFDIIDKKSRLGGNNLSDSQNTELTSGYKQGLDVTNTLIIPVKPSGLGE